MATQFDPIAKDESLNTTEATPRNIADVIAEGLKGIEDALPTYTEGDGIDITNNAIGVDTTFSEASTRANIASGDSFSTILGKIKKFFTDLKAVAFSGAAADVTYGSGSVEDALDGLQYESELLQAGVTIKRLGKLRVLHIGGTFTVNVGAISITALPSKDRPSQNILGEVGTAILSSKNYPFSINLKTDGTITGFALDVTQTDGYKYLTGSPQIYATFTYAVN